MGKILPKTLLAWKEPEHVRRERERSESETLRPWTRPLGVLVLALAILVPWSWACLFPAEGRNPPPFPEALAMGLAFGLFMVYVVPLIYHHVSSRVTLNENGVMQGVADQVHQWSWKEISGFRVETYDSGDVKGRVLVVTTILGTTEVLGIDPEVPVEGIEAILRDRGVRVLDSRQTGSG